TKLILSNDFHAAVKARQQLKAKIAAFRPSFVRARAPVEARIQRVGRERDGQVPQYLCDRSGSRNGSHAESRGRLVRRSKLRLRSGRGRAALCAGNVSGQPGAGIFGPWTLPPSVGRSATVLLPHCRVRL